MKNLDKFIESLKENFGDNLLSIIAFGSQANVEDAKNNLNLMVVTNELTAENLYTISKPVQKWVKAKNPVPVIMNKDEWYSSFDVYAIEYGDIKSNYKIITPLKYNYIVITLFAGQAFALILLVSSFIFIPLNSLQELVGL